MLCKKLEKIKQKTSYRKI